MVDLCALIHAVGIQLPLCLIYGVYLLSRLRRWRVINLRPISKAHLLVPSRKLWQPISYSHLFHLLKLIFDFDYKNK